MANRNFDQGYTIGKRLIELAGSFVPLTGAGTVVASTVRGYGFGYSPDASGVMALQPNVISKPWTTTPGIVRTGTGVYTITLEDLYLDCNCFSADLAVPAGGSALRVQPNEPVANLGSSTAAPVCTLTIVNASGTPTDAGANSRVHFFLQFRDSTTQRVKP